MCKRRCRGLIGTIYGCSVYLHFCARVQDVVIIEQCITTLLHPAECAEEQTAEDIPADIFAAFLPRRLMLIASDDITRHFCQANVRISEKVCTYQSRSLLTISNCPVADDLLTM